MYYTTIYNLDTTNLQGSFFARLYHQFANSDARRSLYDLHYEVGDVRRLQALHVAQKRNVAFALFENLRLHVPRTDVLQKKILDHNLLLLAFDGIQHNTHADANLGGHQLVVQGLGERGNRELGRRVDAEVLSLEIRRLYSCDTDRKTINYSSIRDSQSRKCFTC